MIWYTPPASVVGLLTVNLWYTFTIRQLNYDVTQHGLMNPVGVLAQQVGARGFYGYGRRSEFGKTASRRFWQIQMASRYREKPRAG